MNLWDKKDDTFNQQSDLTKLINRVITRRAFLKGSAATGLSSWLLSSGTLEAASFKSDNTLSNPTNNMTFKSISAGTQDTVMIPEGYQWNVLISWGDPIFPNGQAFDSVTRGTASTQRLAFGDNNDGMSLFKITADHAVLVINNEYVNRQWLHSVGKIKNKDDFKKELAAHGVSIVEIKRVNHRWKVFREGTRNRRIIADTPMEIVGPARGHAWLKTSQDATGSRALGTWNNCANGQTPWGTYLTCEENFNAYFASKDSTHAPTPAQERYGITARSKWEWYLYETRFDIKDELNESNRFGYVVEIDPHDPASTPKKLTALGRFKHENAEVVIAANYKVVVYLGDDERGEYLYRFISKDEYQLGDDSHNRRLLEEGTLYVAKFDEAQASNGEKIGGKGKWIPLIHGKNGLTAENGFNHQAEISILTRNAADLVGATTMDRPEWVAANPLKAEVYCALTNNKNRGKKANAGGKAQTVGGPNPRAENHYGQIVRWIPQGGDHTAETFDWDLFVMAGNPLEKEGLYAGSSNIHADNMFNAPDGLKFDPAGRLWIQTDGDDSNEGDFKGMGNNQMLCADPATGEIRRFLVGPVGCEITGVTWSSDRKTMFVGVQHPGAHFPDGGEAIPRASVVAVWKKDGGDIGT